MRELHLPWLEMAIVTPLLGAVWVSRQRTADLARRWCLVASGIAFACVIGAWGDFHFLANVPVDPALNPLSTFVNGTTFVMDQLNAPLLMMVALLFFLTVLATLRTKVRRFSFTSTLVSEAITLATFCTVYEWGIIALLALGTIPPFLELRNRGRSTRIYALYMTLFVALLITGQAMAESEPDGRVHSLWAIVPLLGAVLVRSGIAPFHSWMTDLFENATFGAALLFATPIVGAYAAVRLVLPIAPDWVLRSIGIMSLVTAVYAGGLALVQRDARRYFCYLFLSHSALVLVGLEMVTPIALTGALCMWLSTGLALGGFGLTLRALEARCGRLPLTDFQGHYSHTPSLAMCFVLTGLASVGFPGTFGFIGSELLVDGAVAIYPSVGIAVVVAAALNGIAIIRAYFLLFTGKEYVSSVSLNIRARERYSVFALAALILVGGFFPQSNVKSRHAAAVQLLHERESISAARPAVAEAGAIMTHW